MFPQYFAVWLFLYRSKATPSADTIATTDNGTTKPITSQCSCQVQSLWCLPLTFAIGGVVTGWMMIVFIASPLALPKARFTPQGRPLPAEPWSPPALPSELLQHWACSKPDHSKNPACGGASQCGCSDLLRSTCLEQCHRAHQRSKSLHLPGFSQHRFE